MEQEKGNFRGRVFGGFDRQDVIDYIEELATERNMLRRENDDLRERLWEYEDGAAAPAEKPEDDGASDKAEDIRRELEGALEDARELLRSVRAEYDALCADVKINATHAEGELRSISTRLTGIQETLRSAGERLEEISERLEDKKEQESAENI